MMKHGLLKKFALTCFSKVCRCRFLKIKKAVLPEPRLFEKTNKAVIA